MKSLPMDFFINIFLLLLSIFLIILASGYPAMARHFPQLVLVMIIVVTVLALVKQIWMKAFSQNLDKEHEKDSMKGSQQGKLVYMIILMFLFFVLLILLGLPIAVFGFILFSAWTLGYKRGKMLLVSSLGFTAFVYLIFVVVMKSLVPEGMIFDLLGGLQHVFH